MVDPHVAGHLHTDGVPSGGRDLGDLQVADDDVALSVDRQSEANQF